MGMARCLRPNRLFVPALAFLLCGFIGLERLAIPEAKLIDPFWARHEPASGARVDHYAWDRFLAKYVKTDARGLNRVAYADVSPADRAALDDYLRRLYAIPAQELARPEQLAYWVNLYNARTVALVLDHYPVESIRDIKFGLFSFGPWSEPIMEVQGRRLSLNDVEHGIIRPIWRDPRIHYVVNCGAVGCPELGKSAYTGDTIEASTDAAAREYINDPRGVRLDRGRLTVSKIYGWFEQDFGGSAAGVLAHLRRYAAPPLAARLERHSRIDDYAYDWSLNDAGKAPREAASAVSR
jgi:hypothetical protein